MAHADENARPWWQKLWSFLRNLNLFRSKPPSTDEVDLYNERVSTKLFLLLLILSTMTLTMYVGLVKGIHILYVEKPSFMEYSHLYSKHSSSLNCLCTRVSIAYDEVFNAQYSLHEVCGSVFITDSWIQRLSFPPFNEVLLTADARTTAMNTFQGLRVLCQLANRTVANGLTELAKNQYVSATVTPTHVFHSQIQAILNKFFSSIADETRLSLELVQDIIYSNGYWSARLTNFLVYRQISTDTFRVVQQEYDGCNCGSTSSCGDEHVIWANRTTPLATLPGWSRGCLITRVLLRSTLECFYDAICIERYLSYFNGTSIHAFPPMTLWSSSRYQRNSTIQDIVNSLMIENQTLSIRFDNYYKECHPQMCTYTVLTRNGALYIATTLFGLVGGLMTILRLCIPILVRSAQAIKRLMRGTTGMNHCGFSVLPLIGTIRMRLLNFNLFSTVPPATSELAIRSQRISTRLFIGLLLSTVIILGEHISLAVVSKSIIVQAPTREQYHTLQSLYPQSLTCPCSHISIKYDAFLSLQYKLHPVCTSYLVTQQWYDIFDRANVQHSYSSNFGSSAPYTFQALQSLCEISDRTVSISRDVFFATQYVTLMVTPLDLFQSQAQAAFNEFVSSASKTLLSSMQIISDINRGNGMTVVTGSQFHFVKGDEDFYIQALEDPQYTNCSCQSSAQCTLPSYIGDFRGAVMPFYVPGMYVGCTIVDALMQSSLTCFYYQGCVNRILTYLQFNSSFNAKALTIADTARYRIDSTVQELLTELMVETWHFSADHQAYFDACQPVQCTYTLKTRNDLLFIITTLFGLIGGVVTVLKFILPLAVPRLLQIPQFIRHLSRRHDSLPSTGNISIKERIARVPRQAWNAFQTLNLFPSSSPDTDNEWDRKNQRLSTKIFLGILFLLTIILLIQESSTSMTTVVTISHPSIAQYTHLYATQSPTLSCPCSTISIDYLRLIRVQYTLHQLCRSVFVTEGFKDVFLHAAGVFLSTDFRALGAHTFQSFTSFCGMADRTIIAGLERLNATQYVTATLTPAQLFHSEAQTFFNRSILSTTSDFLSTIRTIHDINHVNALFSARYSNYGVVGVLLSGNSDLFGLASVPAVYSGCVCSYSSECVESAVMHSTLPSTEVFVVPGLFIGCTVTQSALQSTLGCLYNATCLSEFRHFMGIDSSTDVVPLDRSLLVRFSIESTVQELVNQLMVETWNFSSSFENYYDACHPTQCSYTRVAKNDAIDIVTTLFSLVGGLSSILGALVPLAVKLVRSFLRRHRGQVTPVPSSAALSIIRV